jgi:hypothetical protein
MKTAHIRSGLTEDLGSKRWFLKREPGSGDVDDDEDEDHLLAVTIVAAGLVGVFVILTVACATVLAVRFLT